MTSPKRARAPGKLLISGAYAVLEGAPAIVSAVDRYAVADSGRPAEFVSEEMRAAMPPPYPWIDASSLRRGDRKLGLGSSAAILVAALATQDDVQLLEVPGDVDPYGDAGRRQLFERALAAHRRAQGGGSGVDVAASTFGGTSAYRLTSPLRQDPNAAAVIEPLALPREIRIEVWASPHATRTSEFLSKVYTWRERAPHAFAQSLERLGAAAEAAIEACRHDDARALIAALSSQCTELTLLGEGAGITIVEPALAELGAVAAHEGACVLPSGAGGGDVALLVSAAPPSRDLRARMLSSELSELNLGLAAPGVHRT